MVCNYEVVYRNKKTGKIVEWEELSSKDREALSGEFTKLFNTTLNIFLQKNLSKGALKLAVYIWGVMVYCNRYYYDRSKAAKMLNIQPTNISGALIELVNNDFCVPAPEEKSNVYIVNPNIAFKGTENDRAITQQYYWKLKCQMNQPPQKTAVKPVVAQFNNASIERQTLVQYLLTNSDSKNCVYKQVNDIVQDTGISKPSVIKFLKFMEEQKVITRPQRGLIKIIGELN